MNQVYSDFALLGQFVKQHAVGFNSGIVHIVLDLPAGYALAACSSVPKPCLIITGNSCPLYLIDLLALDPDGLIAPYGAPDIAQIERAVIEISAGGRVYLGPPLHEPSSLSLREHQVVRLVALGCENNAIALELSVTDKTVRNLISGATAKLGLKNRVELARYYLGLHPI